jgi:uncharacterized protein YggE
VQHANDQVVATLAIEEQDKDKAVAASRVNTKMRQGLEILKKEDPVAMLKTQGYYTYPVYAEERPLPNGQPARQRAITGWRVAVCADDHHQSGQAAEDCSRRPESAGAE